MSPKPDVSIVIVNWNSKALLRQCLTSILDNQGACTCEIVVIDNASFDGCGEMIAQSFPAVTFIQSQENLGFGKANNLAAAQSHSDVLLFLNPDTKVIGDAIARMVGHIRLLPQCGALGGTLLNSDGSIQTSALLAYPTMLNQLLDSNVLRRLWPRSRLWGMAPLFSDDPNPAEVEAISGACLMMRRQVFDAIGGFSAEYFMYSEDTDICYKAHLHGYRNYFVPHTRIVHFGDGSVRSAKSSFAVAMAIESLWRFMAKHRGAGYAAVYRGAVMLAALCRLGLLWLAHPIAGLRRSPISPSTSLPKWNTILRWSLTLENWVLRY